MQAGALTIADKIFGQPADIFTLMAILKLSSGRAYWTGTNVCVCPEYVYIC